MADVGATDGVGADGAGVLVVFASDDLSDPDPQPAARRTVASTVGVVRLMSRLSRPAPNDSSHPGEPGIGRSDGMPANRPGKAA
jgi:hypothetical protein